MLIDEERLNANVLESPALCDAELLTILDDEFESVARAESRDQKVYRSLKKLSALIGSEYGDRVLYELLQNAHDAHVDGPAEVAVRLVVENEASGELFVANGGCGFTRENLQAVRNIANSTKEIGEGIGNKGVGFRSVEALTEDPHIYSCRGPAAVRDLFNGYCFRFATPEEIRARLAQTRLAPAAETVAAAMPRYLAAVPVDEQPEAVCTFARKGFATVVRLPLRSKESVALARRQVDELITSDAPVLLFLERISALEVTIEEAHLPRSIRLTRVIDELAGYSPRQPQHRTAIVTLGPGRQRWLLVRRTLQKEAVIGAVRSSIPYDAGLRPWLDWRGDASVAVATPLDGPGLSRPRLYTFLPMGADAASPCFAHVDAPFFTNISRRGARPDLPLNAFFLSAAADICAAEAISLVRSGIDIAQRCVVDLVAWRAVDKARLEKAFQRAGATLGSAEVWPTTARAWCGLRELRVWPAGSFKVFTASRATRAGVSNLLNLRLAKDRLDAIQALAAAAGFQPEPSFEHRAEWAEAIAAALPTAKLGDERWSNFFGDLVRAFDDGDELATLQGRLILPDRTGALQGAGEHVYIRHETARRRKAEVAPLPPHALARKLVVLSEEIRPRQDTISLFEKAGLWRRYDATEILERLPSLFGDRPAPTRRQAALLWAFDVWRVDPRGAKTSLAAAELHVPTRGGWTPAAQAAFSESWTPLGRELDAFLAEARESCPDCAAATLNLLSSFDRWQGAHRGSLRDWTAFLSDAGVVDGLVAAATPVPEGPMSGSSWWSTLYDALGLDWVQNGFSRPHHPQTAYWRTGEAWKLPGQSVVARLSPEARRRFAILAVRHLEVFGKQHLTFRLSRTDRGTSAQDRCDQQTPLALFLAREAWFPMEGPDELSFRRLSEAWVVTERRSELRFLPRQMDELGDLLLKSEEALQILSSRRFGLRLWRDPETAPARLTLLAEVCEHTVQHDRPQLQSQYVRAWSDLLQQGGFLPHGASLVVRRSEGFSRLEPADPPQPVYVPDGASGDLTRLLIESGQPVLAVTDQIAAEAIIAAIGGSGGFDARPVGTAQLRLLVDGMPFRTAPQDPLLTDVIPWLPEALVLGHELGARAIERGARVSAILEKLRRLRLRQASSIALQTGEAEGRALTRHLHRDDRSPTLIVVEPFDARRLDGCATLLTDYLNQNLRTFELLLVKLSYRLGSRSDVANVRPLDSDYADALDTDVALVREYLAAFRQDDDAKIELLVPVLAYYLGAAEARDLGRRLAEGGRTWWPALMTELLPANDVSTILTAVQDTDDLTAIRRKLGLDYARFNRAVLSLGLPSLTSEDQLKREFLAWKNELRDDLQERLRRHFVAQWRAGGALQRYAELRSLEFIDFDSGWVETEETLTRERVLARAQTILESRLGSDPGGELPNLTALRLRNRKAVMALAERARPILLLLRPEPLDAVWVEGSKAVVDTLDRQGFLDFAVLAQDGEILRLLSDAALWPASIQPTLDLDALGLSREDLDREARQERDSREAVARERNRVRFSETDFDAADPEFASRFAAFAHEAFAACDWRKRTSLRPVSLTIQTAARPSGRGGDVSRDTPTLPRQPPEAVRSALGLAGELLALEYLKAKHPRHFNETSWVSENRVSLYPEPGSVSHGCDFRVQTADREWLYEVKATRDDSTEFELTDGEYRAAVAAAELAGRDYRVLFVQHAFSPERCRVLELPNPEGRETRAHFKILRRSSVRLKFDLS